MTVVWGDSFNPKNILKINSLKFEIVCCLYNLTLIYFQTGSYLLSQGQDEKSRASIGKFRNALWCLS